MNSGVKPGAIVFVDTNVIIEAYRTKSWAALAGAYRIETVEDCVRETQTGYAQRTSEEQIAASDLTSSLAAIHQVTALMRAEIVLRIGDIALDRGEESLWAHAVRQSGTWFLCGPDRASLRVGFNLGFREQLVSLEELVKKAGHRTRHAFKDPYTKKWLDRVMSEMVVADFGK